MNLRIRDLIEVPPVETVIRLEEGETNSSAITSSFVCTSEVRDHLTVFASILERESGCGFFLEGDFGSGKSHFLAALSAWLDNRPGADRIESPVPALAALRKTGKRMLPVDISLVKFRASVPFERICTAAIETALKRHGIAADISPLSRFRARLGQLLSVPSVAADFQRETGVAPEGFESWFAANQSEAYARGIAFLKSQGIELPEAFVEERHEIFTKALSCVRSGGFDGMVLIVDELSEFFRSKPDAVSLNEDARTLQLLGEIAGSQPLWIIAAVQESIERTGDIASATFRKIKDRFPVRLHLSTLHIRDLVGKRLVKHRDGAAEKIHAVYEEYKRHFPRFACPFDQFLATYPIHPETFRMLEGLGELFSQHRGIVDFVHARIGGDAARGIAGILDQPAGELLAPDAIFDHFSPRLAEISTFHAFPRQVIPHLDEVIGRVIPDTEDQRLAKRLVRILLLYAIHPTATPPSARMLAELCACMLADHDPGVNVEFVTGAILDPIAAESRFLSKRAAVSGDPLDAVYTVGMREDHAGNLRRRIEKAAGEIVAGDSRAMAAVMTELPAGISWPGPEVLRDPVERSVTWRQSGRRVLVAILQKGGEAALSERLEKALAAGDADFAFVMTTGDIEFRGEHIAVWRIGGDEATERTLIDYFAAQTVAKELHPSNPSHAPLVPLVREELLRLAPAARSALLDAVYAGTFDDKAIAVEPAALQLRRFDRLLESAAAVLLEERYPRFKEIAPRLLQLSQRLYQRIVDEFICLGAVSMGEARAKTLTEAIETLAAPLGILEVKAGSYRLAPAIGEHPFLNHFFSLLRGTGPTPLGEVRLSLRTGIWGVPSETVDFLLVALAQCGIITLQRHGRAIPLDLMPLSSVADADAVAPGELIGQADRETITAECAFLSPQGGFASFGLRQQREAWQALVKMKKGFDPVLADTSRHIGEMSGFAAFAAFDFDRLRTVAEKVNTVFAEVKSSYPAREGLERFLGSWRSARLSADDLELLKRAHRFFGRFSDRFIYISHYIRHTSADEACRIDPALAQQREAVGFMLGDPMQLVVPDEGVQLGAAFELFREMYSALYAEKHRAYYESLQLPALSKSAQRMVALFAQLIRIEQLDRPAGIGDVLAAVSPESRKTCTRSLPEVLLRSPACGCGFSIGDVGTTASAHDLSAMIERGFAEYVRILAGITEALTARAYAIRDIDPAASGRLEKLCALLRSENASPAPLLDLLDEQTIDEIKTALSGSVRVQSRTLAGLVNGLAGRRLTPSRVRAVYDAWVGNAEESTIIAIEGPALPGGAPPRPSWWPAVHPELNAGRSDLPSPEEAGSLEKLLEEQFPAAGFESRLKEFDSATLLRILSREPLHTAFIRSAWVILLRRILAQPAETGEAWEPAPSRHCIPDEAAALDRRIAWLRSFAQHRAAAMPDRLPARLDAAGLWADPWSTGDLRKEIDRSIAALGDNGADWLATLPGQEAIDLRELPVVLIIDALPPDVWVAVAGRSESLLTGARSGWRRLTSAPQTVPSLGALFGFNPSIDPLDGFANADALYLTVSGDESHDLVDLIPEAGAAKPLVIRFNILDSSSHKATLALPSFPQVLGTALARHLPGMLSFCRKLKRRLILTADHGLSFSNGRLLHGKGGVFEKAVIRVEWEK